MKQQNPPAMEPPVVPPVAAQPSMWSMAWPYLLTVLGTALVVGGAMYAWSIMAVVPAPAPAPAMEKTPAPEAAMPAEQATSDAMMAEHDQAPANLVQSAISGTSIAEDYSYQYAEIDSLLSLSKSNTIFMNKKAIAKFYENDEKVESFAAPTVPGNPDVVLLSTSEVPTTGSLPTSTNRIYAYNINTGELTKLYEENETRILRTVGMDGSKLIVMEDYIDNSPGPCFSLWADWTGFGSLELSDIASGLHPYTVPDYQVQKGKADQQKCEASLQEDQLQ